MAIKSVSELQYSVAPSTYTNLTLVPAEYIGTVLGINTYVSGTSYSAGNKVIHNGTVYVAGDGILGTPGASGSNWTATSVSGLLGSTYTAGTNISIANNQISCTYELPAAGAGTGTTLGGVRLDGSTIKWSGDSGTANVIQVDAVTSGGTDAAKGKIVKVASDATTIATSLLPASALVGDTVTTVAAGDTNISIGGTGHDYTVALNIETLKTSLGLGTAAYLAAGTSGNNVLQLSGGKIPTGVLPDLAITNVFSADSTGNSGNGLLSSSNVSYATTKPRQGDVCIVTENGVASAYILTADTMSGTTPIAYQTLANWSLLSVPSPNVLSITGSSNDSNNSSHTAAVNSITINNAVTTASTITLVDAKADGSTKGIAAFNSAHFTASEGVIDLAETYLTTAAAASDYQAKISTENANGKILSYSTSSGFSWVDPTTDTTYSAATSGALGLVIVPDVATSYLTNSSGTIGVSVRYNGGLVYSSTTNDTGLYVNVDGTTLVNNSGTLKAAVPIWKVNTGYSAGTVVWHGGRLYKCVSDQDADDAVASSAPGTGTGNTYWSPLVGGFRGNISTSDTSTSYSSGDFVLYNGLPYVVRYPGSKGNNFAPNTLVTSATNNAANSYYQALLSPASATKWGLVKVDGETITAVSSTGDNCGKISVDCDVVADRLLDSVGGFDGWTASNSSEKTYYVGDVVYWEGQLYKCIQQYTTSTGNDTKKPGTSPGNSWWQATDFRNAYKYSGTTTVATNEDAFIEIEHKLGTKDITVQVYQTDSDDPDQETTRIPVLVEFEFGKTETYKSNLANNTNTIKKNNITLRFANGQLNTQYYRVVILAAR